MQRDADAAAERAAHWCSLAQALQCSALLSEGGASPCRLSPASSASAGSRYSPPVAAFSRYSPAADSAAKPGNAACPLGSSGPCGMPGLLGELRSPLSSCNGPGTQLHLLASPAAIGAQGVAAGRTHGLIAAFQAVASTDGDDQLQGSPVLQRCAPSSPVDEPLQSMLAGSATAVIDQQAGGATPASSPAASAELAPGTSLQLLHKLANPGLSCASSLSLGGGRTPLTPQPCGMAAGTGKRWGSVLVS